MQIYDVTEYGAVGDGVTNDTLAIQKTVDACAANGGGCVIIPAGKVFCSASIRLRSNIDFHIEAGATIIASGRVEDYTHTEYRNSTTGSMSESFDNPHALIYAVGENNVVISGYGTIDGNAEAFMDIITRYHISGRVFPRPKLIMLGNCKKVTVTQITLKNASTWVLHPAACEDVLIHGIRILCNLKMANSDGIDPDHCRNVRISDCHIECADDCIVIKNTRVLEEYGPTENIVITGCTLISTSCAIKIGTETVSDFRNIIVDSCIITNTNRGLGIQLRDEGNVENVRFTNISINTRRFYDRWWGKAEPIYVTNFDRDEKTKVGKVKNIYFGNISCKGENGVYINGEENNKPEEIVLDNVRVELHKWTKWDSGIYDKRPCVGEGLEYRDNAGVYCANAKDVTLRDVKVVWDKDIKGSYGAALETENVEGLVVKDFIGKAAFEGKQNIIKR